MITELIDDITWPTSGIQCQKIITVLCFVNLSVQLVLLAR